MRGNLKVPIKTNIKRQLELYHIDTRLLDR